jgi:asparagine synthase (glutamine-hydrolysing)
MRSTIEKAVERHLISDAPVGLFLSGGIDSSILALVANKTHNEQLRTLSIIFNEKGFSEEKYQNIISKKINADHFSFLVTKSIFNDHLSDSLRAMDQPSIDGINTYFISKYAKEYGLKAVLSGIGADELFGGYPSFHQQRKLDFVRKVPSFLLKSLQHMPDHRIRKLSYAGIDNTAAEYLLYRGIFTPTSIADLLNMDIKSVFEDLEDISTNYPANELVNGNKVSWIETNFYMQNQLLKDSDFMSMWHGIEIRVPFLDKEVMLMAGQIGSDIKFNHSLPKYLLVKAFEKELPVEIWNRTKQGFTFPFAGWLKENEFIMPSNNDEVRLYDLFKAKKLSWGRYWCALLMSRFSENHVREIA